VLNRPVLLFDGDCGFCRDWVRRLQRWDRRDAIDYVPSQERERIAGLPPLREDALARAIHLVAPDGTVTAGARTLPVLGRYLPSGWLLRAVVAFPGALWIGDRVYAWVARRRHRLGCGSESCRTE